MFGREKRYWLVPHTPPDERRRMLSESLDVHLALPALSGDDVETGRVELIGQPSLPMPVIVESEP